MDPAPFHRQPTPHAENTVPCFSRLEPENDASVVPEVALVGIAGGKVIAEAGEHEIKLRRSDGDGFAQWDVYSSANDEIPGVVAGVSSRGANILTSLEETLIGIRMRSAKEGFYEGFEMLGAIFQNGAYVIGKHVSACLQSAPVGAGAVSGGRKSKGPGEALITLEIPFDSKPMINVNRDPASAAV